MRRGGCITAISIILLELSRPAAFRRPRGPFTSRSRLSASRSRNWKPPSACHFCKEAREASGRQPPGKNSTMKRHRSCANMRICPGLVRSSSGDVEGRVSLGMPASLSTTLVGPFIEKHAGRASKDHPEIHRRRQRVSSRGSREEPARSGARLSKTNFFPWCFANHCSSSTIISSAASVRRTVTGPTISLEEVAKIPLVCRAG